MPATSLETEKNGHHFPYRIPLYEIDIGQAVYHGNYFHFFELAREAFLRDLGRYTLATLVGQQRPRQVVRQALRAVDLVEQNDAGA